MRRLIAVLIIMVASAANAQIRRPPTVDTCDGCPEPGTVWCEIAPAACADCWDICGDMPGEIIRRRPTGPYNDPRFNYSLPRLMGVCS